MAERKVYLDLTEFFQNPLRTGVQRVCLEIVSNWIPDLELIPLRLISPTKVALFDKTFFDVMADFFAGPNQGATYIRNSISSGRFMTRVFGVERCIDKSAVILCPELFYDMERIRFYERLLDVWPEKVFFIVHDFLPVLKPELFDPCSSLFTTPYFRLLTRIKT